MKKTIIFLSVGAVISTSSLALAESGKEVFKTYCWGCHHQTAVAFGPPFEEIATNRNADEIRAMIIKPETVSKVFGYRRNAMPSFNLDEANLTAITTYILSYKSKVDSNGTHQIVQDPYPNIALTDTNTSTKDVNGTRKIIKEPYPNIASVEAKEGGK